MKNKKESKVPEWKKKATQALNEMHKALGEGKTEAVQRVVDGMARLAKYSVQNQMLILMQCPSVRHVRGYSEWQDHGRQVRKGEKGISIIAPRFKKDKETNETEYIYFVGATVFDIAQTEGPELGGGINVHVEGNPGAENLEALEIAVRVNGIKLGYADELPGGVLGVSKCGEIQIRNSMDEANKFRALAHELAHEKMHKGPDRAQLGKDQKECEAECVAAAVCGAVGMECGDTHRDYVQLYNADVKLFESCLKRIQETVKAILSEMEQGLVEVAA